MPVFPRTETKIMVLVGDLVRGLRQSPEDALQINQPVEDFEALVKEFNDTNIQILQREAELKTLYGKKKTLLNQVVKGSKRYLRLLQSLYPSETELARFGWGLRRKRKPVKLPGQPRVLEVAATGEDWLILDWKPSKDGGKVRFYEVYRRIEDSDEWKLVEAPLKSECRLKNQPNKTVMEFYVVAKNPSGASIPSNTIRVVL